MTKKVKTEFDIIAEKLDKIVELLKHSIVVQLYNSGASQDQIKTSLHMGKSVVNKMVKGIKKMNVK